MRQVASSAIAIQSGLKDLGVAWKERVEKDFECKLGSENDRV